MSNHALSRLQFDAPTSKRAQRHTFEYTLEAPGMVRVTNTAEEYADDDPEDHSR